MNSSMQKEILFIAIFFGYINAKHEVKLLSVPNYPAAYCSQSYATINNVHYAAIVSMHDLLLKNAEIKYIKCHDAMRLDFNMFPLASSPNASIADPHMPETFILRIPQGCVYAADGIILINDRLVKELIWHWSPLIRNDMVLNLTVLPKIQHVAGKVAVITQEGSSNYYHWMTEILPKLAMLEMKQINYDWLYVPTKLPFMRQTLAVLGIDSKKIIEAKDSSYVQADELIVPSAPALSGYTPCWIADYLKTKFIQYAEQQNLEQKFNNKVFISRKKASYRRIINEDELFKMFELRGFTRYALEDLSLLEQVLLFKNADIVVAAHGAGLINLLFSKPGTRVIEIFQEHEADVYWYLGQTLGLDHTCIKTTEFKHDGAYKDTVIPLHLIQPVIDTL